MDVGVTVRIGEYIKKLFKSDEEKTEEIPREYLKRFPSSRIYISYSSMDKNVADEVCRQLESREFRCWIAPRNVTARQPMSEQIFGAIKKADWILLIFSKHSQESKYVLKEMISAFELDKPIVSLHIDDSFCSGDIQFYVNGAYRVDGRAFESGADKEIIDELENIFSRHC